MTPFSIEVGKIRIILLATILKNIFSNTLVVWVFSWPGLLGSPQFDRGKYGSIKKPITMLKRKVLYLLVLFSLYYLLTRIIPKGQSLSFSIIESFEWRLGYSNALQSVHIYFDNYILHNSRKFYLVRLCALYRCTKWSIWHYHLWTYVCRGVMRVNARRLFVQSQLLVLDSRTDWRLLWLWSGRLTASAFISN